MGHFSTNKCDDLSTRDETGSKIGEVEEGCVQHKQFLDFSDIPASCHLF